MSGSIVIRTRRPPRTSAAVRCPAPWSPRRRHARVRARISSQSTSQIHETSVPSAMRSFRATIVWRSSPAPRASVASASLAPAGFLISSMTAARSASAIRWKRPNAGRKRASPDAMSSSDEPSARATPAAARAFSTLYRPGTASSTRRRAERRAKIERDRLEPSLLDPRGGDRELRARVPAGRAAIVAEMAEPDGLVVVWRAAANAEARVRGVRERSPRERRIVDAVRHAAGVRRRDVGDQGVVGARDQRRLRPEARRPARHRSATASSSP